MGYLLARHVPRREMPEGLPTIRAVAGWSSSATPRGAYPPSHPARRWLQAAREHAQRLGAPPDLDELTAALADGVIRTERSVQAFGDPLTGSDVDLRAVAEFAGWCGRRKGWRVIPAGTTPDGEPVTAVVADRRLMTRAQRVPRQVLAATGIVRRSVMMRQLSALEVKFDATVNDTEIDAVCGLRGVDGWVCRPDDRHSTLAGRIRRILSITGPIRLDVLLPALARVHPERRLQTFGQWPPPPSAVQVWARHQDSWTLDGRNVLAAIGAPPAPRRSDALIAEALADGARAWGAIRAHLMAHGASDRSAQVTIHYCPLIRQDRPRGPWRLIHHPPE